jgi:hypothetical protein
LTTTAYSGWTIAQTIAKWKVKFPGDTSNYGIFIKSGKKSLKKLDDDKTLGFYQKLLEDPKAEIIFQNATIATEGKPKPKVKVNLEAVLGAIKTQDPKTLRELLDTDIKFDWLEDLDREFGQLALHIAVRSNNPEIVSIFVKYYEKHHMNINQPDKGKYYSLLITNFKDGWTALHYAVCNNTGNDTDEEILLTLLHYNGIQVDVENTDKNIPLHYFASKFICPSCQELGEKLISLSKWLYK